MKPSFFELEGFLSAGERKELFQFAQVPFLKASKKSLEMLELLTRVPTKMDTSEKKILWLRRKLFPTDKDDRNFRRTCRQVKQLYYGFVAFQGSKTGPASLFPVIESLMGKPLDKQLATKLKELEKALPNDDHEHSSNFLRYYLKEDLKNQFLSKRRRQKEYQFDKTLRYLDLFYFIEKLKYGISYLQVGKVQQQELPQALEEEIDLLAQCHEDLINDTPILQIYFRMYQTFLEGAVKEEDLLLKLLNKYPEVLKKHIRSDFYNLIGNYLIARITQVNQPLSALRKNYQNYFRYNQSLVQAGLLKERDYIPARRFQNVFGSALNAGRPQDIQWAELFLAQQHQFLNPDDQERVKTFCQAALYFYQRRYQDCLKELLQLPYFDRFMYCDIKTLEMRTCYEYSGSGIDFSTAIPNIVRTIRNDADFQDRHKNAYINFFHFFKQLFQAKYNPNTTRSQLLQLQSTLLAAHPVAQKKWLLEKLEVLLQNKKLLLD